MSAPIGNIPAAVQVDPEYGQIEQMQAALSGRSVQRQSIFDRTKYYIVSLMFFSVLMGAKMSYDCRDKKCSSFKMSSMIVFPVAGLSVSFIALVILAIRSKCVRSDED